MKKIFAILFVSLFALTAVFSQELKIEKTITITSEDETFQPKLYWLNATGKGKLLGAGDGEYTIPAKATGVSVTKFGDVLKMADIQDGDQYMINPGNPGLNSLGVAMTYGGAAAAGLGLGFVMIGVMEGDNSILVPAASLAGAGFAVMGGGFLLNKNNKPTFIKK